MMAFDTPVNFFTQSFQSPPIVYSGSLLCRDAPADSPLFDILDWYPQFQSCHKYFLDYAQHQGPVQALAAFINIRLPYQKHPTTASSVASSPQFPLDIPHQQSLNPFAPNYITHPQTVSLIPYIRRLVATGLDTPALLHGLFGNDWSEGIGSLHEAERRNYLFASKSTSWLMVKQSYEMGPEENIPFLNALANTSEKETQEAEAKWSEWLAMQDWMLGPRAPATGVIPHF